MALNLIVGIVGVFIGGFLITTLLGLRYDEGFNLATIAVATLGAVIFLVVPTTRRSLGWKRSRSSWKAHLSSRERTYAWGWMD
jgi:hypothetical protein